VDSESALIVAVPEAEPLVKELRDQFDPSAALGAPAHITLLYPFMPPNEITAGVLAELRDLFAQFPAFEFALTELRRFPEYLHLAPSPAEPFKALTYAITERFPNYPPYGGAFSEVIPHLTVAGEIEAAQLDVIAHEFMQQHGARLPVKAWAHEVLLIGNSTERWEVRETFTLAE